MSFAKNVFTTFVSKIILIILGIISSVIIARTLGPAGKGAFAILGVIVGVVSQFGNLGLHASNVYFLARDKSKRAHIVGNSFWVGLVLGIVLVSVTYILTKIYPHQLLKGIDARLLWIMLISIPFSLLALFFQHVLVGEQKFNIYNLIQILNQLLLVLGVVIFLWILGQGILSLVVINTVTIIIGGLSYLFYIFKTGEFSLKFNFSFFCQSFRYGIKSYIACFLSYLILRSDLYLLNFFRGQIETGLYSLATSFADLLFVLPTTIGLILAPKISSQIQKNGEITARISGFTSLIMFLICLISGLLARPVIALVYGQPFLGSTTPFLLLLPGVFFMSLSSIYMNHFAGRGFPLVAIYSPLVALVINLILNLLYIPRYGLIAAALSSSITYIIMFLINLIYFLKTEGPFLSKMFVPYRNDLANQFKSFINHIKFRR